MQRPGPSDCFLGLLAGMLGALITGGARHPGGDLALNANGLHQYRAPVHRHAKSSVVR
jgi:hypothetical protein